MYVCQINDFHFLLPLKKNGLYDMPQSYTSADSSFLTLSAKMIPIGRRIMDITTL
ncbi:hypothetical protein XBO1_600004 [Xenorhabdus bovienii str. oregonense]|uniref:Uncharacterized protein n=1 Tax=Xenorhabdus bovienii str. oregonense TaxID=1398202 RepID=A0A077NZX1_XENBV|nr:hypothetical protein XBO1_600004 [Xenorhabdus bovienii str. oregonense]